MSVAPTQLMNAAKRVATQEVPILENRWHVTSAALARQAVESAVEEWLASQQIRIDRNQKVEFLCLRSLHPDPELAAELHHVWCRLSDSCHATTYEMPPSEQELRRWFDVIDRFLVRTQAS